MKKCIKSFFDNEILSYLFFGLATTIVAIITRILYYALSNNELLATALGNIAGILFAFVTNDTIFLNKKERVGSLVLSSLLLRDSLLFYWIWDSHSFSLLLFLLLLVNLSTMTLKRSTLLKLCLLKLLLLCSIMFLAKSLYLKINQRNKKQTYSKWWLVFNPKEL